MTLPADPPAAIAASGLAWLTAAQMAEVDRLAVDEYGVDLLQMMEQVGSHLAEVVRIELGGSLEERTSDTTSAALRGAKSSVSSGSSSEPADRSSASISPPVSTLTAGPSRASPSRQRRR